MRIRELFLKYSGINYFIALFIWISFFPAPIQQEYHLLINIFLCLIALMLFARKGFAVFKLNDYPVWVFLAAVCINVLFAQQKVIAFKTYLDLAIPMVVIYYLALEVFSSENKGFILLAKTVSLSSIIVSLIGILECLFAFNPLYEYFLKNPYYLRFILLSVRPMSTQFNPTPLAGYMLGCVPFNYFLYRTDKSIFKLLGLIGIVLNICVIILTYSRCAFLGLIAIIAFYLFVQRKYRALYIFVTALLIIIFTSSYLPYPFNRFGVTRLIERGILSKPRETRMYMALRIFNDHPLAGLGFQHFRLQFFNYYPYNNKVPYEFRIEDNMYLTIISETGIIGFLGFFTLVGSFIKKGWRRLGQFEFGSEQRWQLLTALMAFTAFLVNMAGYEFFYWPNQYLFFCLVVGCVSASLRL